jgi:hypothetical protein
LRSSSRRASRTALRSAVKRPRITPANAGGTESTSRQVFDAARTIGLQINILNASTSHEINAAFAGERPDALFVAGDPFFTSRRVQIANLAARDRMPAAFANRDFVAVGALMSYGTNIADSFRQSMSAASSRAPNPPTCQSCSRRNSSSSSTCTTFFEPCDTKGLTRCLHRPHSMFASKAFTMCPAGVSWRPAPCASCQLYWCSG